jgi:hypothetical protein
MDGNVFSLLKICIEKIKDEILIFSIVAILLIVTFPNYKILIFSIFCVAVLIFILNTFIKSKRQVIDNKHSEKFSKFLSSKENWEKRMIDSWPVFFYRQDNNYKIEQSKEVNKTWNATESWMENFPDPHITEYKVYLKYGETKIEEILFVSCDGGRYFIPLPNKRVEMDINGKQMKKIDYYWVKNSIEYQVGIIIGDYYRKDNLQEVARDCGIKVL